MNFLIWLSSILFLAVIFSSLKIAYDEYKFRSTMKRLSKRFDNFLISLGKLEKEFEELEKELKKDYSND